MNAKIRSRSSRPPSGCSSAPIGARQGYLEVFDPQDGPTWWRAADCSDDEVEIIRSIVSRGIIGEALAQGEAVVSNSAILDARGS